MQKISSYLYPNRVQLLADLASFNTEYTNVYQRIVKIYNGIDNTIEFDIKNADQKRIDLAPYIVDSVSTITMNVMDASGNALPNSPYTVTPMLVTKGIATVTIPAIDLEGLVPQFLKYSVNIVNTLLYADSRFGAVGTLELVGTAMPVVRPTRFYDTFTAEIDLKGAPIYHSSAIPSKFYEAVPTATLSFQIGLVGLIGSVWLEAATSSTISVESFKYTPYIRSFTATAEAPATTTLTFDAIPINNYEYFRISYTTPQQNGVGAGFTVTLNNNHYVVILKSGGTGYAIGSKIKVLGSVVGGVDGINDLIITVTAVDSSTTGFTSSYAVSAITGIDVSGTAANGTATYIVSGTNISGTVTGITVTYGNL